MKDLYVYSSINKRLERVNFTRNNYKYLWYMLRLRERFDAYYANEQLYIKENQQ